MSITKRGERLARDEERFPLDVDHATHAGNPRIGGGADVHEQEDRRVAPQSPIGQVEPFVGRACGSHVGCGRDPGVDIDVGTVVLASDDLAPGTESLEVTPHLPHQRRTLGEHSIRPRWIGASTIHLAHDRAIQVVTRNAVVPLRVDDRESLRLAARTFRWCAGDRFLTCEHLTRTVGSANEPCFAQV